MLTKIKQVQGLLMLTKLKHVQGLLDANQRTITHIHSKVNTFITFTRDLLDTQRPSRLGKLYESHFWVVR
jgi:hypothetical protein